MSRPERCCSAECEYSVPRVRYHLDRLLAYQRAGELPGLLYTTPSHDRYGGKPGDGETASIDVGRVVEQLTAVGLPVSAEAVAARLCPWSRDGE